MYDVDWYDTVQFCNTLSILEGLDPVYFTDSSLSTVYTSGSSIYWKTDTNGYRLPTEAEWEFAARGDEDYPYSGSILVNLVAWYDDNPRILQIMRFMLQVSGLSDRPGQWM